jgi:hypothetical protein
MAEGGSTSVMAKVVLWESGPDVLQFVQSLLGLCASAAAASDSGSA